MKKKDIEQQTFANYQSGFHCAEAILKTFVELYGKEILDLLGDQEAKLKCKKLTADAAGMLHEIFEKENSACK